jgi:hypothetical protein
MKVEGTKKDKLSFGQTSTIRFLPRIFYKCVAEWVQGSVLYAKILNRLLLICSFNVPLQFNFGRK